MKFENLTAQEIAEFNKDAIRKQINKLTANRQKLVKCISTLEEMRAIELVTQAKLFMSQLGEQRDRCEEALELRSQNLEKQKHAAERKHVHLDCLKNDEEYQAKVRIRYQVILRDANCCHYCGKQLTKNDRSIDHKIPKCLGGQTTLENCVLSCKTCNNRKAAMLYEEFLEVMAQAS